MFCKLATPHYKLSYGMGIRTEIDGAKWLPFPATILAQAHVLRLAENIASCIDSYIYIKKYVVEHLPISVYLYVYFKNK
jgi:hypothetical protein